MLRGVPPERQGSASPRPIASKFYLFELLTVYLIRLGYIASSVIFDGYIVLLGIAFTYSVTLKGYKFYINIWEERKNNIQGERPFMLSCLRNSVKKATIT